MDGGSDNVRGLFYDDGLRVADRPTFAQQGSVSALPW
jgi:hypothetical protein